MLVDEQYHLGLAIRTLQKQIATAVLGIRSELVCARFWSCSTVSNKSLKLITFKYPGC